MIKILTQIISKNIFLMIKKKIYPYYKGLFLYLFFKNSNIQIHIPKYNVVDEKDLDLANRIFSSFKKMKSQQSEVDSIYKPSSLWQKLIDQDFKYLNECLKENNLKNFLFFLQNFGNWDNYLGIENQLIIKKYSKNIFLKKYLKENVFNGQKLIWEYFNNDKDISSLNMPRFGNQNGALIDKNFVVIGSFFNHIYSKIIINYLDNNRNNSIVDLGAGYGKLAYYILSKVKNCNFIDFDIPETLVLASYYLAKSFPNKKTFFYGEKQFDQDLTKKFDLVFLPNWEFKNIKNDSIDITINRNSLGEMDSNAAINFINHIHRSSKYFFSMNHETFKNKFSDGKYSLINKEFNMDNKFRELIRYPDLGHITYETNKINLESDIFFYLYEKK